MDHIKNNENNNNNLENENYFPSHHSAKPSNQPLENSSK